MPAGQGGMMVRTVTHTEGSECDSEPSVYAEPCIGNPLSVIRIHITSVTSSASARPPSITSLATLGIKLKRRGPAAPGLMTRR